MKISILKFKLLSAILLLSLVFNSQLVAQVSNNNMGIGTSSPHKDAILEVKASTKGLLVPRLNVAATNWMPGTSGGDDGSGMVRYNQTTNRLEYWNGTTWLSTGLWNLEANNHISYELGNVGIGTDDPQQKLDIAGNIRLNNTSPTLYLQDTDQRSGFLHVNSNLMYFLSGGVNAESWTQNDSRWPLTLNMETDQAIFGGSVSFMEGNVGIGTTNPLIDLAIGDTDTGLNQEGDGNLAIYTNNSERVRIGSDGRVEIYSPNDASGSPGSGALEIGNPAGSSLLRMDNNEIITNTDQTLFLQSGNNGNLSVDGSTLYVDASENRVGIGTSSPEAPLHVNATTAVEYCCGCDYPTWINPGATSPTTHFGYGFPCNTGLNDRNIAAHFNGDVRLTSGTVLVDSDVRLKNNIMLSSSKNDLNTLKVVEIVDYKMIDTVADNTQYKKVIAQQIESVYPLAVTKGKGTIPNIMQPSISTQKIGEEAYQLSIGTNHNLLVGDRLELKCASGTTKVDIVAITSPTTFIAKSTVKLDEEHFVFVYGKEVDDLHSVDYDALAMLNISATQEIAKQVETLQAENEAQANEIFELKAQLAGVENLEARLMKIEALLKTEVSVKVDSSADRK